MSKNSFGLGTKNVKLFSALLSGLVIFRKTTHGPISGKSYKRYPMVNNLCPKSHTVQSLF